MGLGFEQPVEDMGESIKRERSESIYSHNLQDHLPVSGEEPAIKDFQPDSNPELDHNAAGEPTRPWRITATGSSDLSRSLGSAISNTRKIRSNIIDQLFQELA